MNRRVYSLNPVGVFVGLIQHWELIYKMTKRNVVSRYKGSVIGMVWSLLHPVLMLTVYTLVFSLVFKLRWGDNQQSNLDFAAFLFTGMIIHSIFSESLVRSPTLITGNVQYVKKVVFPLEVLAWVTVFTAVFHALISTLILIGFLLIFHSTIYWTVLLIPVVLLPLLILSVGTSWFLASIGVFIKDVAHIVGILSTVLFFISPILYPIKAVPENLQGMIYINPLTLVIEQYRGILILGNAPNWDYWFLYLLASLLIAWFGLVWFQKTRRIFPDVL